MTQKHVFDPETGTYIPVVSVSVNDVIYDPESDYEEEWSSYDLDDPVPSKETEGDAALYPPNTFYVESQTVRTATDGSTVVDVIIEIDDDEAVEYEVRVTK